MAKNSLALILISAIFLPGTAFSEGQIGQAPLPVPFLSFEFQSGYSLPFPPTLVGDSPLWGGAGLDLKAIMRMPFWTPLFLGLDTAFTWHPVVVQPSFTPPNLVLSSAGVEAGISLDLPLKLGVRACLQGGVSYAGVFNGFFESFLTPSVFLYYLGGGVRLSYRLIPAFGLYVDTSLRKYAELAWTMRFDLGVSWNLRFMTPAKPLDLRDILIDPVFPVLFKYYDTHSFGRATLVNRSQSTVENITVTFYLKQYMDNPQPCIAPRTLKPGESGTVEILGLFTPAVLGVAESMKAQATVRVECTVGKQSFSTEVLQSVRLFDPNATMWDDDRKAAAFITPLDKTVQLFYSNAVGAIS